MDYKSNQFYQLCERIVLFLSKKGQQERQLQTKEFSNYLGNCNFWIDIDKDKDGFPINPRLAFSLQPKHWNVKKIVDDLRLQEHQQYLKDGIEISQDRFSF